jgi:predicted enzyme related to lactoylglutathione lyase
MSDHQIVHIEFVATDPKKAGKFYGDLFGWDVETTYEPSEYTMFRAAEGPSGAFPPAGEESGNAGDVLVYVSTDDVDATLAKAESLGGEILMPKFEIPTVGWMGIVRDPTGIRIAPIKFVAE